MADQEQLSLYGIPKQSSWEDEWQDMPEYISEDQSPVQQIIVSFASYADVQAFAELLGMTVSPKTNSTWFPHRPHTKYKVGYKSET